MKRLLFLGNSHLAAVKLAWDQAAPPGYETEFFGAPQRAWTRMAMLPGNQFGLTDATDFKRQLEITEAANGKASTSLDDRDVIIMVGGFSAADPLAQLLADCDVPALRETGAPTLLTEPLFAKACAHLAGACLPEPGWHNRTQTTVALMPRPATADSCLTSTYPPYQHWHRLAAQPAGLTDAFALYDTALAALMTTKGLTYIPQPPSTRTAVGLTPARYLAEGGGTIKGEEHRRGDHAHMNAAYGADCVAQIITWLQSQS